MHTKSKLNNNQLDNNKVVETSTSLKRNTKRDNIQSCYFRIKFKKTANNGGYCYSFVLNTNLIHNHPPDKSKNKEVMIYI